MIKNYFKTAWRNLVKNKSFSAICIGGLAMGLAVGILILLWVHDELSYNKINGSTQHVYRLNSQTLQENKNHVRPKSQGPMAVLGKKQIPEVEAAVRVADMSLRYQIMSAMQTTFRADNMAQVDPAFFDFFRVPFLEGNKADPLPDKGSVVLSKSVAEKYFGNQHALGKVIRADHKDAFTVTGVIPDLPQNSDLKYGMFFSTAVLAATYDSTGTRGMNQDWDFYNFTTYVKLKEHADPEAVSNKFTTISLNNDPYAKTVKPVSILQPVSETNLYQPDGTPSGVQMVKIFMVAGVLLLFIACVNYINLSTASAITKAREVSIRKIIGARSTHLFSQFTMETALLFLVSLGLALGIVYYLMPAFNTLSGKNIQLDLFDPALWKLLLMITLFTFLVTALYPAILLSSFKPVQALKGNLGLKITTVGFRKVLVTAQFVFSVILIIATIIISRQLQFVRSKNPGYNRAQVLRFDLKDELQKHPDVVKSKLEHLSGVQAVALSNNNIVENEASTAGVNWDGKKNGEMLIVSHFGCDENFIPLMEMKMVSGNNFTGGRADSVHFILNETAVKLMGLKDPIGKQFDFIRTKGTIIGVVKDFNFASMRDAIKPMLIHYKPQAASVYVKIKAGEAAQVLAFVQRLWKQYNSDFPFEYAFLDESYDKLYRSDQRMGTVFNIFSVIAVVISCLGLLGLTAYMTRVRLKEIGVRKLLGAGVLSISVLLSKNFVKLVVIAILIATPVTWYMANKWLEGFAYRIQVEGWMFLLAGTIAIAIAVFTMSVHTIRAARSNPVKSLRSE